MNNRSEFVADIALTNVVGAGSIITPTLTHTGTSVTFGVNVGPINVKGPIKIGNNYYESGFQVNYSRSITLVA